MSLHTLSVINDLLFYGMILWGAFFTLYFVYEAKREGDRADRAEAELNELKQTIIDLFPPDNAITKELKDNNLI